jgi:hypothetical protein
VKEPPLFDLPERLKREPTPYPEAPATAGRSAELPFDKLPWDHFELLALDYLRRVKGWKQPRLYGSRGHAQRGIDLVDMTGSEHPSCQVKRKKTFGPADFRNAVNLWIKAPPLASREFSVMLSRAASPQLIDELHTLREEHPSVRLTILDAALLNDELRGHPDLIRIHFHEAWVDAFCDPKAIDSLAKSDQHAAYLRNAEAQSDHRLLTRALAAGISPKLVDTVLASAKRSSDALASEIPTEDIVILEGPFGAGKSALLESLVRSQLTLCAKDGTKPLPVFVGARGAPLDLVDALPDAAISAVPPLLLVDGLDEAPTARRRELVAQAASLLHAGRVSRVVISRRPGESLLDIPIWSVPEQTESESEELMSLVAQREIRIWYLPGPARDAVRRPLFAIIAGTLQGRNRRIPESEAEFLNALVTSALGGSSGSLSETLLDLAVRTLAGSGRVPASQIGDLFQKQRILATRLVVEEDGELSFSLPILEQFFAALALRQQQDLVDNALADIASFDRWRYALAMALAMMSWEELEYVFSTALRALPGTTWRLVSSAFAERRDSERPVSLPGDAECEARLYESLTRLVRALGESSRLLPLVGTDREVLPVGVTNRDGWMTIGLWTGLPEEPRRDLLPRMFHQQRSEWIFQKSGRAHFSTELWPIGEAIDLVDRAIQVLLQHPGFPVTENSGSWPERRYEIARSLADETSLLKAPVGIEAIQHPLRALADAAIQDDDERALFDYRFSGRNNVPRRLVAWASELRRLALELETAASDVVDPWTSPDNAGKRSGWTWDLWTQDAWRLLVAEVYEAALEAYNEITQLWLEPLRSYMGLGCIWPVELRLNLAFSDESGAMPGAPIMTGRFAPLQPGSPARVTMVEKTETWGTEFNPPEEELAIMDQHHPGLRYWSRWAGSFVTADVAGMDDAPSLSVAYQWIIEDLVGLGVIKNRLFRRQPR